MPELPEVQTVVNELKECVLNQPITNVYVSNAKIIKNTNVTGLRKFLVGEQFIDVQRVGKYILLRLTHDKTLVSHLRMEGKYYYEKQTDPFDAKHVLLRIQMSDNELRYHDTRRFGTIHIYVGEQWKNDPGIKKLACDPLDAQFDGTTLYQQLQTIRRAIKTVLLDQTVVAGIGNIYADEILFACAIHPQQPANTLTKKQVNKIAIAAKRILLWAIAMNGTTIASYKFKKGHIGSFQEHLKVHMRAKKPCLQCQHPITKIQVGGRGTYFCNHCQKQRC